MNPRAPIRTAHFGQAPVPELLDIHGFYLDEILEIDPSFLEHHHHHHDDAVRSFVLRAVQPLDGVESFEVISWMIQVYGNDLLRYKGVLALEEHRNPRRVVFQGVHMLMGGDLGRPWGERETRESVMVFIGRKNVPKTSFCKGWSNASSNLSEETGRAGRQARAPLRGAGPQDVGTRST